MKRARKFFFPSVALIFLTPVIYALWFFHYGFHEVDYCFQCGAKRTLTNFGERIQKSPLSLRVEAILGHECEHRTWKLDYAQEGSLHADGFHERYIPLLSFFVGPGELLQQIEILPNLDWQRQVVIAVGTPDNRLRWVAAALINNLAQAIGYSYQLENRELSIDRSGLKDLTPEQWQAWWNDHEKYFQVVEDQSRARELFQEISSRPFHQYGDIQIPCREGGPYEDKIFEDLK